MKLIFDSSVWIEHLRRDSLTLLLPHLRGRYQVWMDGIVAAELLAGCRSRIERRVVDGLLLPFRRTGRLQTAAPEDIVEAGRRLSRLRERGVTLKNPGAALLDAAVATNAVRLGALLISENKGDFEKLAEVLPLHFETLADLAARVK